VITFLDDEDMRLHLVRRRDLLALPPRTAESQDIFEAAAAGVMPVGFNKEVKDVAVDRLKTFGSEQNAMLVVKVDPPEQLQTEHDTLTTILDLAGVPSDPAGFVFQIAVGQLHEYISKGQLQDLSMSLGSTLVLGAGEVLAQNADNRRAG